MWLIRLLVRLAAILLYFCTIKYYYDSLLWYVDGVVFQQEKIHFCFLVQLAYSGHTRRLLQAVKQRKMGNERGKLCRVSVRVRSFKLVGGHFFMLGSVRILLDVSAASTFSTTGTLRCIYPNCCMLERRLVVDLIGSSKN